MPPLETDFDSDVVRSFIDLGDFARNNAELVSPVSNGNAFLDSRLNLPLAPGPVTVGIIHLETGSGEVGAMPADEFLILYKGSALLEVDGKSVQLTEGNSLVLTAGARLRWSASASTILIFMRRTGGPKGQPCLIPIDESASLEPSGAPLAELLVGPTPDCRNHTDYRSADGEFVCGTWDSTPYHRRAMRYGHYELMHLTCGSVSFVDGAGRQRSFREGDIFLVEQGAECSWESREHVKKVYAIYRPV